ncbi:MAG TPA: DUF3788 family protein [Draconibacterium sp.]|jgi:hypothetical protein|nr:DUF3788 family protein [Draconibacterium sp.]
MDTSIFMDLSKIPETTDLAFPLGKTYPIWKEIRDFVIEKYPAAIEEWHVAVKKYGWGFRIKDKKRAIIYLSPREGFFLVAMVFGQKATDQILNSDISANIKEELMNSKVYMEGRVIRCEIHDNTYIDDIKKLVEIKIAN